MSRKPRATTIPLAAQRKPATIADARVVRTNPFRTNDAIAPVDSEGLITAMAKRAATVLTECRTQAAAVKHINDPALTKISDGSAAGAAPSEVPLNDPHSPYGSAI